MNFVGKFDAKLPVDGSVAHSAAHAHVDGASTHAPSDAIIIPDAQLLFGGDFKRSGVDLVLSDDHHELVLHDYFKGEKRVALSSPDGAHLTGDLVNALAGHVEYAQADGTVAAAVVVGHVTKLAGTATAIRNGVSIILNAGDNIDKGDVLQSGADSTLGVTFIDGTVFGLSSNARMVVNEMIYDPNGSNNSSLLSLVAGTISFVAGETAKHGDMKVDTPVATMGIRGTAVLVEIDFSVPGANGAPSANFQVLMEPDGTTGSYILFDKNTLAPLATVNTAGTLTKISEGIVSFQAGTPLTADQKNLIDQLFTTKFGDITKSFDHFTDTPIPQSLTPINLPGGVTATPVVLISTAPLSVLPAAPSGPTSGVQHVPGAPLIAGSDNHFIEAPITSGSHTPDTVIGQINFLDVNIGDQPSVTVAFNSFSYQDVHHNDITTSLTAQEKAAVAAIEGISVQANPGNNNNGSATWTYSFPDGAFDFLGAGETLTLTYTALVNNNYAQSPEIGTTTFTITITGTNDVPVITSSVPQTIAFVGGTSVPGGDLTAHVPTSGTISFDDPDLTDTHTVSVELMLNGLDLPPAPLQILENALTASIATDSTGTGLGTVNWKLADLPVYLADFIPKGETITLTYAVTVTDSQGATSTQDIKVTITGTDTPAVVWIATTATGQPSGGLWSDASNWETGTVPTANDDAIIITDQLIGLTPSYPVTIDAETAAVAKSVTMNDFGTSPPELINLGTLTVGGAFDMSADSILHNSGTITVGGLMEVLDTSVLLNSGTLTLEGGGDFAGTSTITNTGTIDVSGGTLKVEADVANAGGTIDVDGAGTLALDSGTIDGGTINNGTAGSTDTPAVVGNIDITGSSTIENAHLNYGKVTIEANQTLKLDNDIVTDTSFIDTADGALIQVDDGTTLTLSGVHITGGTINDGTAGGTGSIDVTGDSSISGASLNNGAVTIEAHQTLTLHNDTVTGTSFIDTASGAAILIDGSATLDEVTITGGTITNSGATLTIDLGQMLTLQGGVSLVGGTLSNSGMLEIEGSSGATLDGVTVTGSGNIQIDVSTSQATPTLVLDDGTSITGGTLTVGPFGTLAIETAGGATLNSVKITNENSIEVFAGSVLTLDQVTTVDNSTGVVSIDGTGRLSLDEASISGGTVNNHGTLTLGGPGALKSGTLNNYSQVNVGGTGNEFDSENITNTGAIAILALGVLSLDHIATFNNAGGIITVDGTGTLALNDASISGGTINDYSLASSPAGSVVAGDIHVTGSSAISSALLNNGQVTIDSGVVLTLDNDTVTGTHFSDTGATVQIDGDTTLKLSDVTITGGTINDYSTGESDSIVAGNIDITGASTISNAHLVNGHVTIESGVVLTLDNDTVTGTHFSDAGATIQIDGGTTLKLDGATITGGIINDYSTGASSSIIAGDIDIIGSSTISDASLNHGHVTIESGKELTLDGDTVNGTAFTNVATGSTIHVDGDDTLTLNDATTITGGSVTIGAGALVKTSGDVTLTNTNVTNDGKIEVTNGILKITGSVGDSGPDGNGSIQIDNGAVLDLNGSDTQDVVFAGAGGKLQIDASSFEGSISGLTAGDQIDLSTIGYGPNTTGTYVSNADHDGGVLTITDGMHSISMTLVGDYSNAHFAGSSDGAGTLITLNTNDDAPVIAQADKAETATVTELADTTDASTWDASTPASGTIHFTDIDLTDRPSATMTQTVAWTDGTSDLTLTPDQISTLENAFALTQSGNTNNGTLGWSYQVSDGALDFLGAGETATVTSTIALDDHQNGHDTATVTVTITGANDLPTITAGNGTLAELPDVTGGSATDTATGTISFSDADLDDHPTVTASLASSNPFDYKDAHGTDLTSTLTTAQLAAVEALESGLALSPDSANANSGTVGWTYSVADSALDFMAAGDTLTLNYTATADDHHGGTATAPIAVTITGANDLPTITAGNGTLAELPDVTGISATDTATGTISFSDVDLDDHKTVTASLESSNPFDYKDAHGNDLTSTLTTAQLAEVAALESGLALSSNGANANSGTVGWTYSVKDGALDFMAAGDTLTLNYTSTVNNQNGGTASAPITVTITGSDDAPAISGVTTAVVTDGGVVNASGHLVATDPDRGDAVTWSIIGGTNVASENYNYGLDEFKVVKGSTTIFNDTFTGTAPPNGPNFLVGTTPAGGTYFVSGGSFATGPHGTLLEGANAAPAGISLGAGPHYGDVVYGQFVTLLTGTSYNGATANEGLRSGQSFTASAVFDLDTPVDSTTHYGIRLSDRVSAATDAADNQPGTETVDLFVSRDSNGGLDVVLDELNFESGTSTLLQTIHIAAGTTGITDNEILLSLANSSTNNGHVTASFQVMGINSDGTEVADGGPVAFTATGQIFDDENWTSAQAYGLSVATSDTAPADATANAVSVLQGTYGTLDLNPNGTWQYFLNPGLASVKALAAGQTAQDVFTVAATDASGVQTTKPVDITVTGINDAPVLAVDHSGTSGTSLHSISERAGKTGDTTDHDTASGTLSFTDVDLTDTHTISQAAPTYAWSGGSLTTAQTDALTAAATLALTETDSTHTGAGSIGFSYSAADGSFDFLAANETLKVTYNVTVTDEHGASSIQPVTITITGTNDAPVLAADSSGAGGLHAITEFAGKTTDTSDVDSASGTLSFADVDLTDTHTVSQGTPTYLWSGGSLTTAQTNALTAAAVLALTETDSTHAGSGSIGFIYSAADNNFDFLAANETLKVTYGVTVTDNHGGSSMQPVTITITGTNDAPVLAADSSGADGLHALTERAGKTGDTIDHDSASGSLSFTDADLTDTHALSHSGLTYALSSGSLTQAETNALNAAGQLTLSETDSTHTGTGSVSFSYSAADSSFDFLAAGQTLTVSYSITVTDNSGVSSSQPVTFTITGSNDAPVVNAHNATLSYTENHAPAAIDAALTLSDVDSATLGSATVKISGNFSASEDVLGFTDQHGISGSYDATTGVLSLTGTASVADYQAALASVTYFDNSDNPSAAPRTVSFSVDDGASANSHSNTATATVDVTPVNDPPVVTAPTGAISLLENTPTHLNGISVSDVDSGTSDITVTLTLPNGGSGSLSAGNFDGVTVGGSATALTLSGSVAEINTFLADTQHGVTYTPAADSIQDVTLEVTANDHGATGSGGAMNSASEPVLLDIVPDGPVPSHANLIANGGFENADFSDWHVGNAAGARGVSFQIGSDTVHHGEYEVEIGGIGADVTLSQTVATSAGQHYTLDFWLMNDASSSEANDFSATWNGVSLMPKIVDANPSSGYTEYQFDVIGAANASTLEFSARNDHGTWDIDDVSVRQGVPDAVQRVTDETTSVSGVHSGDALTVTPAGSNSLGTVTAVAGAGAIEWQFAASNAQLDHLMALTQTYTVSDSSNPGVAQTVAVSIAGLGHDQFVFNPGVGADTMVNFPTGSNSQGSYVGDTIELDNFSNIQSVNDVLQHLSTDAHGNAVVDLGNHDSITFQGINAATIQANAAHMFILHSGNLA